MLGIALLVGLAGGAVLTAFAGARRTATTFDRTVAATRAADVLVNPNDAPPEGAMDKIVKLPQVEASARLFGLAVVFAGKDGKPDFSSVFDTITAANPDGNIFHTVDRHRLLAGRYARTDRADEVTISEHAARELHLRVGDRLQTFAYSNRQLNENIDLEHPPPPALSQPVTVTGIFLSLDDAARAADDPQFNSQMIFSPAYAKVGRFTAEDAIFEGTFVRLADGARDIPAFEAAASKLVPFPVIYQERRLTSARITRAVRPYVFALIAFGALAALATLAVLAQILTRSQRHLRDERDDLIALGFTRSQLAGLVSLRGAVIGLTGAALALVFAVVASQFMPLGPLRRVEPTRGMQLDTRVLLPGIALILVLVVTGCVVSILGRGRHPSNRVASTVGDELARAGASVPVVSGVRFALDRGRDGAVPVRSTLVGITVASAALVATLVYGSGLSRFTSTPTRYGWPWAVQVQTDADPAEFAQQLRARPDVGGVAAALYSQFEINGKTVAAIGIDRTDGVPYLPLRSGRAPERDDEIVLGAKTMQLLDAHIGDRILVNAQGHKREFRVVGSAVFPRLAPYQGSEPTGLGVGAGTTKKAIEDLKANLGDGTAFFVKARAGRQLSAATIQHELFQDNPEFGTVVGPQRPSDVQSYDELDRTPLALVAVLVLLAAASLVHLLVTGVRNRRRELALLKTMGLTRAETTRSVLAQATTLILMSLVVAIPLGILAGRWLWVLTARWLGIADDASVPFLLLTGVTLVGLGLTNVIAYLPARTASRVQPAVALRAE